MLLLEAYSIVLPRRKPTSPPIAVDEEAGVTLTCMPEWVLLS